MITEKLQFVQFLHPGSEHSSGEWNKDQHKRRFIKNIGSYVEGEQVKQNDLIFWCEWEAQSDKMKKLSDSEENEPKYLWQPYYVKPEKTSNLQNTDPFVFGSQFYYVCCQQHKEERPTQLKFLKKGSVILFGSNLDDHFVLDTVFVVGDSKIIQSLKDVPRGVNQTYKDVTLNLTVQNRCKPDPKGCTDWTPPDYNLYSGATYENPVYGMFSFFPCLPYANQERGFKRPIIEIKDIVNPKKNQGYKLNEQSSLEQCKYLWYKVKQQVENAGLKLGVYTELPPEKNTISAAA